MRRWVLATGLLLGVPLAASADHLTAQEAYYDRAMADASRFVAEQKKAVELEGFNGIAADKVTTLLGIERFYKKGDRWLVEERYLNAGMVRMTGGAEARRDSYADPIYFEFKVAGLNGDQSEARIMVSQVTRKGAPIEGRVQHVMITVNRRLLIVSKQYFYRGHGKPVSAELPGTRNLPMGFDSFPVELPDFEGARLLSRTELAETAPNDSISFECRDLFMRKVIVQWKRGEVWPTRIRSQSGQTTLILMEKAS